MVNDITDRREKDQKFFLGFENFQRDLTMKIKAYQEDLDKFLVLARNAISNFQVTPLLSPKKKFLAQITANE